MTRTLLRKQLMEVFSWLYRNRKTGKNRSMSGIILYALLYLFLFGIMGFFFFTVADMLCAPLISVGMGWMFMAMMGLMAVAFGVFFSVFNTYASLYRAKDNDFLLAMPIPSSKIMVARLFGVYVVGLMYELIIMVPTLIVYFLNAPMNFLGILFSLCIPLVLSVFVMTLSCILGWVVALISSRLKHKNMVSVVLSLTFMGAYYYFYAKAYSMLQSLLANAAAVGKGIQRALFPLYHMGLAAEGKALSMLIITAAVAVVFGIVYLVLSRSFFQLATANRGQAKAVYREKAARMSSANGALLRKEFLRFLGSPTYMLNCGFGTVMMLVAAVALLVKAETVSTAVNTLFAGYEDILQFLAIAAIWMMTTMNDITAPSVSLEGKNLWLVHSFPVSGWQVLLAKLKLHLILTLVPALVLVFCAEFVLRPTPVFAVMMPVLTVLFVLLMASIGLVLNLKMPNVNWTQETVPVKQSMCVMLALCGGWVVVLVLGGLYFAVRKLVSPPIYLLCVTVLLVVCSGLMLGWLKRRGSRIFERL